MWRRIAAVTTLAALMITAHLALVRPWFARWGAADAEMNQRWPGDELVVHPDGTTTRALTVEAPAEHVWPWLIQTGQDRAGWYSYRLLENLVGCEMPRTHAIIPAFQSRTVGESVWMYPPEKLNGIGHVVVARLDHGRALVLATAPLGAGPNQVAMWGSLAFIVEPAGERRSRLIMRSRSVHPASWPGRAFSRLIFEPVHFVMERKMMSTIKALAENRDVPEALDHAQTLLWIALGLLTAGAAVAVCVATRWVRALAIAGAGAMTLAFVTLLQPPVDITATVIAAFCLGAAAWIDEPRQSGPRGAPIAI